MKRQVTVESMPSTSKRTRPTYKKRPYVKPTTAQVRSIVQKAIYRESETKMASVANSEMYINTIAASPAVILVPTPSPGTAGNQRVGNKVKGVGIGSKLLLHNNASNTACWVRCSLLEVFDGQMSDEEIKNGMFEGIADSTIGVVGEVGDVIRKYDREIYRVLKDEIVPLNGLNDPGAVHIVNFYKKLSGQEMKFNDQFANAPTGSSKFVWVVYARQANNDESVGTNLELTYSLDYYFKE